MLDIKNIEFKMGHLFINSKPVFMRTRKSPERYCCIYCNEIIKGEEIYYNLTGYDNIYRLCVLCFTKFRLLRP